MPRNKDTGSAFYETQLIKNAYLDNVCFNNVVGQRYDQMCLRSSLALGIGMLQAYDYSFLIKE
jgi:hypothetical protein